MTFMATEIIIYFNKCTCGREIGHGMRGVNIAGWRGGMYRGKVCNRLDDARDKN